MIFEHTSREKGMWRGWLKDGQSVEINWDRRGWSFGAEATIHADDDDRGRRLLNITFWRLSIWLPMGFTSHPWELLDAPSWGMMADQEFGFTILWRHRRKNLDWPWMWHTLAYQEQMPDGSWREVQWRDSDSDTTPYSETHDYTYVLRNGTVQNRTATITKRRHIITWTSFKRLGWPRWIKESIDVQFSGEVGERSGSWKGGCIGCSYDIQPGETMAQALRRMERERVFR